MRFFSCILTVGLLVTGLGLTPLNSSNHTVGHLDSEFEQPEVMAEAFAQKGSNPKHRGSGRREIAESVIEVIC